MVKYQRDDIYFLYKSPHNNLKNINSRSISNNIIPRNHNDDLWKNKNIQKIHRKIDLYDYIVISNNSYNEVIGNLNSNLKILILEKNKIENIKNDYELVNDFSEEKEYLIKNNTIIKFDKEMLSIEKYIYNDNIYCVFENKKSINYFSKNIIIANNSIKNDVIMKNITEKENTEYINQQNLLKEKEENKKEEEEQSNIKTTKYYVRSYSNNCYNYFSSGDIYTFSTTPNGKSINSHLRLNKGEKYIFEMTSEICPFNVVSSNSSINVKSNSDKYLYNNVGSILKGESIEFYIPENFNRTIFYFSYKNTKKLKSFKINNKKNIMFNMYLTYN